MSPPQLIKALRKYDLLPAIVFVPSRRKCDEAATEVGFDPSIAPDFGKAEARQQLFDECLAETREIGKHRHRKIILKAGVASHHAGHIPSWKLLVEKMMSEGLLNAIFATSTVAAGVDFPARTVVVLNPETRGNDGWRSLTASELQQMTGRAGRRGRDKVGYVVLAPSRFQDPRKVAELLEDPPDALESKFRSTYTNLLNLLDAFGSFEHVRSIAEKSFAFRNTGKRITRLKRRVEERRLRIESDLEETEFSVDDALGFERLQAAKNKLEGKIPVSREQMRLRWLKKNVREGRILAKGKQGRNFLLVINVQGDLVTAMKESGQGVNFSLSQVKRVYKNLYPIRSESLDDAFHDIYEGNNPIIQEPSYSFEREDVETPVALIGELSDQIIGNRDDQAFWGVWNDCEYIEKTGRDIETLRGEIWQPFVNRARVLEHFGYLKGREVTESGKWLADLRLDRPLLVGEALKKEIINKSEIHIIAGFMAALAGDAEREYGDIRPSREMIATIEEFEPTIDDVCEVEFRHRVEISEELNFSAAGIAELWAQGASWGELVRRSRAEEGDLVRLLSRTGEALMQIAHLKNSQETAAKRARETAEIMLREPIR